MKKSARSTPESDDLLPEYDFSNGVRGKYAKRFAGDATAVVLAPDVAKAFPTARAVNAALRRVMRSRTPRPVSRKKG